MSRNDPSALVGNTSLALTTASEFGRSSFFSRARFSTNNVAGMEPYRVCNFIDAECGAKKENAKQETPHGKLRTRGILPPTAVPQLSNGVGGGRARRESLVL
jgi:hypothetical protein